MQPERYSFLQVEIRDGIGFVTFNKLKPATSGPGRGVGDGRAPGDLAGDDRIRAVVITGSGDTFSGGAHHADDPSMPSTTTTARSRSSPPT